MGRRYWLACAAVLAWMSFSIVAILYGTATWAAGIVALAVVALGSMFYAAMDA